MSASQPGNTTAHRASLEICFDATDLKQRLGDVPRDAMCRGVFFNMLDDRAVALGHAVALEYRDFFRVPRLLAFRMYPLRDYLTRLVVLSQIAFGHDRIHAGLRELQSGAFDAWASTMLGRAALAVANPSLPTLLRVLERAYAARTVVNYARFTVQSVSTTEIVTAFEHEYVYIEHAMVGALEAVMRACGRNGSVVPELDGPYDGRVRLLLQPRILE